MKKSILMVCGMLMMATSTFAQKGIEDGSQYGHGEDSVRAVLARVRYTDAYKLKNYAEAYNDWLIMFNEAPKIYGKTSTLYSQGVTMLKNLLKKEKDEAKKAEYYDMLLKAYDQRMKYYGNNKKYPTTYLQGMRALDMMAFKDDVASQKEAKELLAASLTGAPATLQGAFPAKYVEVVVDLYKAKEVDAEEVVKVYMTATDAVKAIEGTLTEDKDKEQLSEVKGQIEQRFASSGAADTETIVSIFGPQLEANKANLDWLKLINRLLSKTDDGSETDLYYATSENMHAIEPAAGSARGLAKMYMKRNDLEKSVQYYNQAIELVDNDEDKSLYYLELSAVYLSSEKYANAKAAAYNSIKLREGWGDPYLMLGRIYAAGTKLVGTEDWEKRAGYWVAVDKFSKAKAVDSNERIQKQAAELIKQYSQYFPTKEDLFMHGVNVGQSYTVGGFIGETTTVRAH
ncbi:MAG: tetratricopeptide repeat protein [Bacteroidia bacterium]|nr:tetratricopeptide repeat protein [Bacteroidia bacterium]